MKYFLDQEFHEHFYNPVFDAKHHIIELISIGIVCEDGREYYAINQDFNVSEAWRNEWLRENVLFKIWVELLELGGIEGDEKNVWNFVRRDFNVLLKQYGKPKEEIVKEIERFVLEPYSRPVEDLKNDPIEFYGYYADYDWVLFCSLFGSMMQLPEGFPMFCFDLIQTLYSAADALVNSDFFTEWQRSKALTAIEKVQLIKDKHTEYPLQTNEHNALADARWNFDLYKFLHRHFIKN